MWSLQASEKVTPFSNAKPTYCFCFLRYGSANNIGVVLAFVALKVSIRMHLKDKIKYWYQQRYISLFIGEYRMIHMVFQWNSGPLYDITVYNTVIWIILYLYINSRFRFCTLINQYLHACAYIRPIIFSIAMFCFVYTIGIRNYRVKSYTCKYRERII